MRNNVATEQRRVVGSSIKSRLCVNGSPIKYGFLAGLRAIQHSMIIAQVSCLTITLFTANSYDHETKTREQNRNNQRTQIERFDWFMRRIQMSVAFGWLSERSGEKTSCPRTF